MRWRKRWSVRRGRLRVRDPVDPADLRRKARDGQFLGCEKRGHLAALKTGPFTVWVLKVRPESELFFCTGTSA